MGGMETKPVPQSVVTNVQYVAAPSFGEGPVTMTCGSCQKTITTRTNTELSSMGWILAIVLCVVGCWPCCLIPCCVDSMQATTHSCPSCNITVGRYNPSWTENNPHEANLILNFIITKIRPLLYIL